MQTVVARDGASARDPAAHQPPVWGDRGLPQRVDVPPSFQTSHSGHARRVQSFARPEAWVRSARLSGKQTRQATHLQLPHNWFAEVFGASVCTQGDKEATVDVLFAHAALSLLGT